jgi:hypothetical protein
MTVRIESAGDHAFDIGHLRRQGGEELVTKLLDEAALPDDRLWRVQVQKKLNCNSETPPARVVGDPKKWAVYLKIKPGDNNSCHFCSLLMPPGFQGEEIYDRLRDATLELDRNWRIKPVDETSPEETSEPAVNHHTSAAEAANGSPEAPEPAAKPQGGSMRGWVGDPEKMQLVLVGIHDVNQDGSYPQDRFVELLCQRMGWDEANRYEVGGIFTSLVRKNLIIRKLRGSRPYGYELTREGLRLVEAAQGKGVVPAGAAAPPARDPMEVIRSFSSVAQRFLDANSRLQQIATRETELVMELEGLRKEREQICGFLDDPEVQKILGGLSQAARPRA